MYFWGMYLIIKGRGQCRFGSVIGVPNHTLSTGSKWAVDRRLKKQFAESFVKGAKRGGKVHLSCVPKKKYEGLFSNGGRHSETLCCSPTAVRRRTETPI